MPIMQQPSVTTAEQLLELDEPGFHHELVRGELRRVTGAGKWHGAVAMRLGIRLGAFVDAGRLGMTFAAETGFLLERNPDTVLCPDASFVRRARLGDITGNGHFPGAPDLAVEVVSPSDTFTEVQEKAFAWLLLGARLVWVVDPIAHTVTVYRAREDVSVLGEGDELTGDDVVPGFAVPVRELFPSLPPAAGLSSSGPSSSGPSS
jgi:Uma2 family endonuclease